MRQFTTPDAKLTYTNLRAQTGSHYEVLVRRGNTEYGMNKLISVDIQAAAIEESGPSVGGVHSTQCDLSLYETNSEWPRMASFTVFLRLTDADGNAHSEYIPMGTFYTDQRNDKVSGKLSIVAFDGMLKMEQSWTDKIVLPSVWPVTARDWATRIQNAHLAKFADLTQLDNETAFIGLNTASTIRDILKDIAAIHGGNWQMVTRITNQSTFAVEEELTLIPLVNKQTEDIDIGQSVKDLTKSPALPAIKKVRIESEDGTEVHAETQDAEYTDYQLQCTAEFASNVGIAALCLGRVSGYVYRPFTANGTQLDPIVEIGDAVKINGVIYQLMSADWKINTWPTANISAPYDEEVDHEYKMLSPQAKTLRKTLAITNALSTEISQTAEQIQFLATSVGDEITNLQNQIDGNIQSWSGNEVPTNDNYPVTSWEDDPSEHVGDVYLVNIDAGIPQAGQYYRFVDNNGVYSWALLSDSALTEALTQAAAALAAANDAQTTAGLKGRIWITRPTPPYSAGDLWFNSTVVGQADILTCTNTRSTGNFVQGDWWKLNKYIDDSGLADFLETSSIIQEIESQLDRKAETYYQSTDPAASWTDPTTGERIAFVVGVSAVGVDRLGISGNASEHAGDLWYKTDNHTTWYFDGSQWRQQDVPDDLFDKIDGKAQIFISQPYPPYHAGDLWFDSETSGIMTCVKTRLEGNYVDTDWQERNKYTDDTTANLVRTELTSELNVKADEIYANVVSKTGGSYRSFGWSLTSDSHTWYSNGKTVMKIDQRGGLSVKGSITALSGVIGDCEIADGKLVVGLKNLSSRVVTFSFTELQYYLSESSETKRGGQWSTDVPDWQENHYYWTRTHTRTEYSDNSVVDSYRPSADGEYNQSLTELIAKTQNAAIANDSTKRQQTLFHSTTGGTIPTKPTAWVNEVEGVNVETDQRTGIKYGKQNVWTPIRPLYAKNYPAVYYVTQAEKADGTITCTDPRLDVSTTVIDGAHILTGTIDANKLAVSELSALGATIGGFTIRSSTSQQGVTTGSIAYGKTSLNDSRAGVYVGTDGISLSAVISNENKKIFSVDSTGNLYADFEKGNIRIGGKMDLTSSNSGSTLTIGGFTIGNGSIYTNGQDDYDDEDPSAGVHLSSYGIRLGANFSVDSNGNLHAESGYFNGTIYAENLQGLVTQEQLNQAVQTSLNYANNYNKAIQRQVSEADTPAQFTAHALYATTKTTASGSSGGFVNAQRFMTIAASDWGYSQEMQSSVVPTAAHWHTFEVGTGANDGKIFIGPAIPATSSYTRPFFNIADTKFYKDAVSAVTVDSLSITTTYNSNTHTYGISCTAYNADNDSLKTRSTATGTEAFNAGKTYATPTNIARRINLATGDEMPDTWNSSTNTGYVYLRAKNSTNDVYFDANITVSRSSAIYQAGVAEGQSQGGDSIGIYTPLNGNNPHESTATDKWFTITSGSNQETVEIYTQYDSQTKTDNVKYSTSTGGYPNGTLFSFARKDIGVRSRITANGTYYASNDNLDGYSAVTVAVPTSGVVTSIARYYGEIDVSSLGNSFDFSDQSGTHTYQFTYDNDSHSYHDITFPDGGGGGEASYTITDANVEEDPYHPYDSSDPYIFNVMATFKVDGISRSYQTFVNVYDVYQAGVIEGSGGDIPYVTGVVNYPGEIHSGQYGSKELDLTTRLYYSDGSYVDYENSVNFYL